MSITVPTLSLEPLATGARGEVGAEAGVGADLDFGMHAEKVLLLSDAITSCSEGNTTPRSVGP